MSGATDSLHIGIDARSLLRPQPGGIGKAVLMLYRHLLAQHPHWRVTAFGEPDHGHASLPEQMSLCTLRMPGHRFDAWTQLRLPWAATRAGVDLMHGPANALPAVTLQSCVATVHDVIPLDFADDMPLGVVRRFRQSLSAIHRRRCTVLCPSDYTRQRLVDHGFAPGRLVVAPWGPTIEMPAAGRQDAQAARHRLLARLGIDAQLPFALHFGAADPRKQTAVLCGCWRSMPVALRRRWRLVIVGGQHSRRTSWQCVGPDASNIIFTGYLPDGELSLLLAAAELMIYPTLAEGFGLPVLEAMAHRTAVLCTDAGSLPQVAGDAAQLVAAGDPAALRVNMRRLMTDAQLRAELAERGTAQLARFCWKRCAAAYARTFTSAIQRKAAA